MDIEIIKINDEKSMCSNCASILDSDDLLFHECPGYKVVCRTEVIFLLWRRAGDCIFDGILEYIYEGRIKEIDEIMIDIMQLDDKIFVDMVKYLVEE